MHKNIREKGGAYGAIVRPTTENVLTLASYRDPNYIKTYENFEKSVFQLIQGGFK